jgi:hypothetical protein
MGAHGDVNGEPGFVLGSLAMRHAGTRTRLATSSGSLAPSRAKQERELARCGDTHDWADVIANAL